MSALEQRLENKFKRGFSFRYVAKLADKVARQSLIEADHTKIAERLNFTRENYRLVRERLMKIVYWEPDPEIPIEKQRAPYNEDVIEAATKLVMSTLRSSRPRSTAACTRSRSRCSPTRSTTSRWRLRFASLSSRRGRVGDCCREGLLSRWFRQRRVRRLSLLMHKPHRIPYDEIEVPQVHSVTRFIEAERKSNRQAGP